MQELSRQSRVLFDGYDIDELGEGTDGEVEGEANGGDGDGVEEEDEEMERPGGEVGDGEWDRGG